MRCCNVGNKKYEICELTFAHYSCNRQTRIYDAVLDTIQVVPPGRPGIAFSYGKPATWTVAPLPRDFFRKAGAGHFEPLVLATSHDGAALFTIGVLALPHGGATLQWLTGLCREGNVEIDATRQFAGGYLFNARHTVDDRVTIIRKFYIETHGHLFAITAMAAQPVFATMELVLSEMTESFRLSAGPRTSFPSILGITLPIPTGWTGFDEGSFAVVEQPASGARVRVCRIPMDDRIFDKIQAAYATTDPRADIMFDVIDGVSFLALTNVRISENGHSGFRAYFVQPAPQQSAMYLAQVTIPDGSFQTAMDTASTILAALPR